MFTNEEKRLVQELGACLLKGKNLQWQTQQYYEDFAFQIRQAINVINSIEIDRHFDEEFQ